MLPAGISLCKSVLITGATSGIGRALAFSIADLPSKPQVIAVGRRQSRLDELAERGLEPVNLDLGKDRDALKKDLNSVVEKYPELDTIVLCAGIQHEFDFMNAESINIDDLYQEIHINYTSVVLSVIYLLPHLQKLSARGRNCSIIIVTSGLSIVPASWIPNYSATKAALHSFCMSLRAQLEGTKINVVEVIPALVESELHDAYGTTENLSKFWMPLDDFIGQLMPHLVDGTTEISIGMAETIFKKFEAGKMDIASKIAIKHKEGQ
ncbi:NAD(P)-binding protein [Guyanagaster necrorhizus]|uniref:NAD(P)-binding protein n=1 Tax=Guyanagaster necrorhizus TaxID=856835 RepID=A0A9P7VHV6_9AGAR|nr:NAD(P)-binding protein [Guyanagaster necrorhizus MCA 3950]KAG7440994.1 NAD(P)-binding protein [Guyanagaster necrorhizus MCA 3950]